MNMPDVNKRFREISEAYIDKFDEVFPNRVYQAEMEELISVMEKCIKENTPFTETEEYKQLCEDTEKDF